MTRRHDLVLAGATAALVLTALLALTRVFTDGTWRPETWLAVALSLTIAVGARRIGFGVVTATLGSLVGLAVYTYVIHLPAGPLLPGGEQLRQASDLLRDGLVQFRDQPAPTAPLDGLRLLVTTGAWIVTAATHEILVRWRRPLLALVPPTVLWVVPLAVPLDPGRTWPVTLPFLAAAVALLLLDADADVLDWTRDEARPLLPRAGVGVGLAALTIAAAAPALLPGYGSDPWYDVNDRDDPRGYQPIVDVGDRLKLPAERDVLRVRSDRRQYLRLAALDTFDGITWRLGPPGATNFSPDPSQLHRATGPLPPEVPIPADDATVTQATVQVLDLENIYVPVPYQPRLVTGPHRDEMVYSTAGGFVATGRLSDNEIGGDLRVGVTEGFEYTVEAVIPAPGYQELQAARVDPSDPALAPFLQLPGPYDGLARQAEEVYAAAGATTAIDKAFALQDWFSGEGSPFTYSTDVPELRGDGALQAFVTDTRTGYCEYFATAMAVMLRATGVPARVSVGFLPGRLSIPADPAVGRDLDTYTVSTSDAHAWVEVLFPDHGWLRFEPTPRSDGGVMVPRTEELDPLRTERQRLQELAQQQPEGQEEAAPAPTPTDLLNERNLEPGELPAGGAATGDRLPVVPLALVAVLGIAGLGAIVARNRRRQDTVPSTPSGRVVAAQRDLLTRARSLGLARRPAETALDLAARWAAEGRTDPTAAARFARIAQAAAFGGDVTSDDADAAARLARQIAADLEASATGRDRLLAPLRVPAENTLEELRGAAARVRDLLDVDAPR